MHSQLLTQSPLLALPLIALLVFLVVFLATAIHAFRRDEGSIKRAAELPLAKEDSDGH